MTFPKPGYARLLATTTALALAAGPGAAQQAGDLPATPLGRLIFGAGQQKVAIDTPQAVTVIDQDDIDRAQPTTVRDALRNVPGVSFPGSTARPLGFAFNIRGIGDTEQPASESRIIVTVDGVPKFYEQYRMGAFFSDPELYKRVEVLRGPASSTLYGSGAVGGVVNFTTKDASDFLEDGQRRALRFKLGYESNGDGALGSAIFAMRPTDGVEFLGALNYRRAGDVKDGGGRVIDGSAFATPSGLFKATFRLPEERTLRLSLQRWTSDEDDARYAQTGSSAFGTIDRKVTDTTATLSFNGPVLGNPWFDYTLTLGYSDTQTAQKNASGIGFASPLFFDTDYGYRTALLKLENRSEFGGTGWDAYLTTGIEVSELDRTATTRNAGVVGGLGFHPEGKDRRIGFFAQAEFVIGDSLTIIPGIRVDQVKRTPGPLVVGAAPVSDTSVSPKLALAYKITPEFSVFGSWARTQRLPTLDELYSFSTTQSPALTLGKEEAETFEIGVSFDRSGVFGSDDSVQIKATAFRNDLSNLVARGQAPNPYFVNIGRARFEGIEIEGAYNASWGYARLAFSHVRGTDRDFNYTISTTPADTLALTLAHRLPDRGLEFGWTVTAVDSISTSSRNATTGVITTTAFKGYVTNDLFVSWRPQSGALQGSDIRFGIDNVFDTDFRNNLAQENGKGRNIKLTLTRSF